MWPKSAYLRHVDRCIMKGLTIPKVLAEAPTVLEALAEYMEK